MHDVPVFDTVAPFYDRVAPRTDQQPLEEGLGFVERRVDDVVDLGGGTGRAARALGGDHVVFDASRPMLERARSHGQETVLGDVRSLPFADGAVDAAISVDALHHFPDVPSVVDEVFRVLGTGGAVVVREFDPRTLRGKGLRLGQHIVGFDCTFFTPDGLAAEFERAGFDATITDRGFVYTVVGVKPGTT